MKISLLLESCFLSPFPRPREEMALLSGRASSAEESRLFFAHDWIRGYADFDVAPSPNESDLGRCVFPNQRMPVESIPLVGLSSLPSLVGILPAFKLATVLSSYRRGPLFHSVPQRPAMKLLNAPNGIAFSRNLNVPLSFISFAAAQNPPIAARCNAEPVLIRRTPAAASSSTERPAAPTSAFTGRGATAAQTVRMASRLGDPGA